MRGTLLLAAVLLLASVTGAGAQLTGAPSPDARQLNFQLFEAAKKGRTGDVQLYLKHGASIKARDRFGNTALLLAAFSGRTKTVKVLLDAGSNVKHQNLGGSTALYRAAKAGKGKSVKLLVKAGGDVNTLNKKGLSPLIAAAFNGDEDMFRLLLILSVAAAVLTTLVRERRVGGAAKSSQLG